MHPIRLEAPRQRGIVLVLALILLVGITLLSISAMNTSIMELRMARNAEGHIDTFQTAVAAIDFVLAEPTNLPTSGPLNVPKAVALSGAPFDVSGTDSITASAVRTLDCAPPPRARAGSSLIAYSAFQYEVTVDANKVDSGNGRSSMAQGYILLGPKC